MYSDATYAASGYQAGAANGGQYTQGATAAYSQPQAQYAAAASTQGGYAGGQPNGNGNAGYYYYYYPVQVSARLKNAHKNSTLGMSHNPCTGCQ